MVKGSGTRSGLLWEVERLLTECKDKPQVLLMENVSQVHGAGNDEHFKEWQLRLEEMGYQSYWEDLTAVDYGIPQTRNRTFMVSILGDYNYRFPKKVKLKLRLKDLLESNVDEKYYLSERMINYITKNNDKWTDNNDKIIINKEVVSTINIGEGSRRCDASNYVSDNLPDEYDIKVTDSNFAGTLSTRQGSNQGSMIIEPLKIKNATKKGYLEPKVVGGVGEKKSNGGTQYYQQDRIYDDNIGISVTTSFNPYYADKNMLRIRKLTPKECFRLQAVKDEDSDLIMQHQTNSSAYHLAGDSITVTVLMALFGQLLDVDWKQQFNPNEWWCNEDEKSLQKNEI